jgi:hypothetical protein
MSDLKTWCARGAKVFSNKKTLIARPLFAAWRITKDALNGVIILTIIISLARNNLILYLRAAPKAAADLDRGSDVTEKLQRAAA